MGKQFPKRITANRSKYDLLIKLKATSTKIIETGKTFVRMESNEKGSVSGKFYEGTHWDTADTIMKEDGTSEWKINFMHITNKGETLIGRGSGISHDPDSKGISRLKGDGTMWTPSPRLSQLNGAKWTCNGSTNIIKEETKVYCTLHPLPRLDSKNETGYTNKDPSPIKQRIKMKKGSKSSSSSSSSNRAKSKSRSAKKGKPVSSSSSSSIVRSKVKQRKRRSGRSGQEKIASSTGIVTEPRSNVSISGKEKIPTKKEPGSGNIINTTSQETELTEYQPQTKEYKIVEEKKALDEQEEPLSAKAREAGQTLKDLIISFSRKAKAVTENTAQEIKSKSIDISTTIDTKDIQSLGANINSIITTFDDTMAEIRKEGYDEQERLLADYKKFLEVQIKVVNARLELAKHLKAGS